MNMLLVHIQYTTACIWKAGQDGHYTWINCWFWKFLLVKDIKWHTSGNGGSKVEFSGTPQLVNTGTSNNYRCKQWNESWETSGENESSNGTKFNLVSNNVFYPWLHHCNRFYYGNI